MGFREGFPQGWQEIGTGEFSPGDIQSAPAQLVILGFLLFVVSLALIFTKIA